ncbi:MAG: DUF559 domain-containing protein [Halofilum sp. (in: g-proteobacteria)]
MKTLARSLRRNMTDAELRLWYHLRARRMGGYKFRRQYPIGPYIVDFVAVEAGMVVEADGGQHADSSEDAERTAYLERAGYTVLRFWNHEILNGTDSVLERIHRELQRTGSR